MILKKYAKTARMAMDTLTNGGILYLLPDILLKIICLVPLMFLWKIIGSSGYKIEMSVSQLLTYTYVNTLLSPMMIVSTYMSAWNYDTMCLELFTRPLPPFGQVISRTIGSWVPMLLLFTLPMAFLAPLLGIRILPVTLWALPSLVLCVSLGFAFEMLFFCLTIRLRNSAWLTFVIRSAIVSFFSGTVIPFKLLPFGLEHWVQYQPFAGLGGSFLSVYVGSASPFPTLLVQLFWNLVIWTAAALWFNKSRERMVSYGV